MSSEHHILCIEDEADIQEIIAYNLERAGYLVTLSDDGAKGLELAQTQNPDLILLDIMLPNLNGMQVCERLKADPKTQSIPIIMLSARSEEADIVGGLSRGADDYMTKPFSQAELLARIKVALRRKPNTKILSMGSLSLDLDAYQCSLNGQTLMAQPGRAFSREQLILSALGEQSEVVDRNVDVHIRGVRKQLGEAASAIETVRGVGYRCDPNYKQTLANEAQ
jgi:DNA-binding response OmpR family regulator